MTLDQMYQRKGELEGFINSSTNNVLILHGQRQEIEYQISIELEKIAMEEEQKLAKYEQVSVE